MPKRGLVSFVGGMNVSDWEIGDTNSYSYSLWNFEHLNCEIEPFVTTLIGSFEKAIEVTRYEAAFASNREDYERSGVCQATLTHAAKTA